mgnify:CR=1 FL=1
MNCYKYLILRNIDNIDAARNTRDDSSTIMVPLPFKDQKSANSVRSKCKFWAPTLVSKLNPFFTFRPGRLAKFSHLRANVPKNRPLTKPASDSGSDCGWDQISDRIGSDSGSDRIGLVSAELLFLRKSCFNNATDGSDFFSFDPPVSLIRKIVFHVSPALKLTISLKIIAKNYFHLNCTEKFSVA